MLEQAAQTCAGLVHQGQGCRVSVGCQRHRSGRAGMQQAGRADPAASEPALSGALLSGEGALLSSEIGDALLKPVQRSANKFSGLSANAGMEGSWGHQALLAGNSCQYVCCAGQSVDAVAWADGGRHGELLGDARGSKRELKLDGLGGETVEVKISLKGDQAHIGFRTDQPEIRQMLEGALAHLKEALKSEGLVLSGVSVGASGQDGSGRRSSAIAPASVRQARPV